MTDRIKNTVIEPHYTVEFISGICHALSDKPGDIIVEIRAVNGKPVAKLKREIIDESLPTFLRRQAY